MAKKKKQEDKLTVVVDTTIAVPEEWHHVCKEIGVYIDTATVEEMRNIYADLKRFRGIPSNVEAEVSSITNAVAFAIYGNRSDLKLMDEKEQGTGAVAAVREARFYYHQQEQDAQTDAQILALTMYTQLGMEFIPKPYEDAKQENFRVANQRNKPRPSWLDNPLPALPRNLENKYEFRLKQLWDLIQSGGLDFAREFYLKINHGFAQLANLVEDENTDEAAFRA